MLKSCSVLLELFIIIIILLYCFFKKSLPSKQFSFKFNNPYQFWNCFHQVKMLAGSWATTPPSSSSPSCPSTGTSQSTTRCRTGAPNCVRRGPCTRLQCACGCCAWRASSRSWSGPKWKGASAPPTFWTQLVIFLYLVFVCLKNV